MSDYPMLISNKLHSFRNFLPQNYTTTITFEVGTSVSAYRKNDKSVNKKAAPIAGTAFYI